MNAMIKLFSLSVFILGGCGLITESSNPNLDSSVITEKYWKLMRLGGQEVVMAPSQEREVHFILKTEGHKIKGFSGCNSFFGRYLLEEGNRIKFDQIAATRRACLDAKIKEHEFLNIFSQVDNYSLVGDTLTFNIGRRAPLAVFKAVYLQ